MKKLLFLLLPFLASFNAVYTKKTYMKKSSFGRTKKYESKRAYEGFGKRSTVNGQIKTKAISGHFKPSNGYKFVNSYARSK